MFLLPIARTFFGSRASPPVPARHFRTALHLEPLEARELPAAILVDRLLNAPAALPTTFAMLNGTVQTGLGRQTISLIKTAVIHALNGSPDDGPSVNLPTLGRLRAIVGAGDRTLTASDLHVHAVRLASPDGGPIGAIDIWLRAGGHVGPVAATDWRGETGLDGPAHLSIENPEAAPGTRLGILVDLVRHTPWLDALIDSHLRGAVDSLDAHPSAPGPAVLALPSDQSDNLASSAGALTDLRAGSFAAAVRNVVGVTDSAIFGAASAANFWDDAAGAFTTVVTGVSTAHEATGESPSLHSGATGGRRGVCPRTASGGLADAPSRPG